MLLCALSWHTASNGVPAVCYLLHSSVYAQFGRVRRLITKHNCAFAI